MQVSAEQMKTYRAMVAELLKSNRVTTAKDIGFLRSLNDWDGRFTWNQVGRLERIYGRAMGEV